MIHELIEIYFINLQLVAHGDDDEDRRQSIKQKHSNKMDQGFGMDKNDQNNDYGEGNTKGKAPRVRRIVGAQMISGDPLQMPILNSSNPDDL